MEPCEFVVLPDGERVPFMPFPNDVPPQDLEALMTFDRNVLLDHKRWTQFARLLCPADGPEGQAIKGDPALTATQFWSDVDNANARVTIVRRLGPGARARQFYTITGVVGDR